MPGHVMPQRTYWIVFALLIALTLLTVGCSFLQLGNWHAFAGLVFATCKATLVILFFMHLIHSQRLTWMVLAAGIFWLGVLMTLTLTDYLTRHWLSY